MWGFFVVALFVALCATWRPILTFTLEQLGRLWRFVGVWVPEHPKQAGAVAVFALLDFIVVYVAHRVGRVKAWIFTATVMFLMWLLFWYPSVVPPLKELLGLGELSLSVQEVLISGLVMIGINAVLFTIMELKEEYDKQQHQPGRPPAKRRH